MTWWRTQRAALIAAGAAAAAVVAVTIWLDVVPNQRPENPVVEVIAAAEIAGQTVQVEDALLGEFDSPEGTTTLSVHLAASGGPDAASCGPFTLTDAGSGRTWANARDDLDIPSDSGERSCTVDTTGYDILLVFLLTDDAVGPFHLDVTDEGTVTRFRIDP